jgi:hypothetical protein
VDELHSIDFTGDKVASILLTPKIEGVKRQSFFDNLLSFPGWCSVRDSSEVTLSNRKVRREGE